MRALEVLALASALVTVSVAPPLVTPAHACVQPFVGDVCTFAFNFCPVGFVPADGRLLAIADNPALFTVIGTTFGGDGKTMFAVPNIQGRAVVGTGAGGVLPEVTLGEANGSSNTVSVLSRPGRPPVPAGQLPSLGVTVCIATAGTPPP